MTGTFVGLLRGRSSATASSREEIALTPHRCIIETIRGSGLDVSGSMDQHVCTYLVDIAHNTANQLPKGWNASLSSLLA